MCIHECQQKCKKKLLNYYNFVFCWRKLKKKKKNFFSSLCRVFLWRDSDGICFSVVFVCFNDASDVKMVMYFYIGGGWIVEGFAGLRRRFSSYLNGKDRRKVILWKAQIIFCTWSIFLVCIAYGVHGFVDIRTIRYLFYKSYATTKM